jgi:hypothetical protein
MSATVRASKPVLVPEPAHKDLTELQAVMRQELGRFVSFGEIVAQAVAEYKKRWDGL